MAVSAKRKARVELEADASKMKPGLDDAKRQLRTFQREQAKAAKQVARDAKKQEKEAAQIKKRMLGHGNSIASSIGNGIGMAGGIAGAEGISGMASNVLDLGRALTRFQILSDKTPEQMTAFRDSVLAVSNATGIAATEVLSGADTYVNLTGDANGATAAMSAFAHVAQASGTPIQDVATAAAAMQDAMKLDPSQFETAFSGLISQGKAGAVGLKDFAGEFSSLLPKLAHFKGEMGADGIMQLGAAFQVARHGFGDASQAATGMESMMTSLAKNSDRFEDAGVKIFDKAKDGTKTFRNLHDIVVDIGKSKLAKDPKALADAFGRVEAADTYDQLRRLPELYDQMIDAGRNNTAVAKDFDTYVNSSSGKMERSWERIKNSIAAALTPERVEKFANAVEGAAKFLSNAVGAMSLLLGGPDKEQGTSHAAQDLAMGANTGDEDDHKAAVQRAKDIINGTSNLPDELIASEYGSVDNAKAGARQFLGTESSYHPMGTNGAQWAKSAAASLAAGDVDVTPWGGFGDKRGTVDSHAAGLVSGSDQNFAKLALAIGVEVGKALRENPPAVKVGAEPIQKAGANSINHRRGQH